MDKFQVFDAEVIYKRAKILITLLIDNVGDVGSVRPNFLYHIHNIQIAVEVDLILGKFLQNLIPI